MDTSEELNDPARLQAVRGTGVGASYDAALERYARLASTVLGTPVALVSILEGDRQVFPGQVGLPQPWATLRATPLTHSVCQYVTASRTPLVVADTRLEELTSSSLAIDDLGVVAYAGVPLTDETGQTFGALCAIDHEPRDWSPGEVALLGELAESCSAELRLRLAAGRAAAARLEVERSQERAALLLRASEVIGDARGLTDLRTRVKDLVTGPLHPVFVGLSLVDGDRLHRVADPGGDLAVESQYGVYSLDDAWPTARCIAEQRTVVIADEEQLEADGYGPHAREVWRSLGLGAVVCKPLVGSSRIVGCLVFGWDAPHATEVTEDALLTAIAGYTATAVERLLTLTQRITAATELQRAMLTEPVAVPGLEVATLYRASSTSDMVGGDWYDVHLLPPGPEDEGAPHGPVALTLGDITGHDMRAAAVMGQARSMLRQAGVDSAGQSPARALEAVQRAADVLDLDLSGTVVHGHLRPRPDGWELVWTNAGHPPPLVLGADGSCRALEEHDVLLYPGLDLGPRADHHLVLPDGAVLLVYTDGLFDDRRTDQQAMTAEAARTASALLAEGHDVQAVVERLADALVGSRVDDDVAVLAVRVSNPG